MLPKRYLDELIGLLSSKRYLGTTSHVRNLLTDLTGTEAYRRNKSFRDTVTALKRAIEEGVYVGKT